MIPKPHFAICWILAGVVLLTVVACDKPPATVPPDAGSPISAPFPTAPVATAPKASRDGTLRNPFPLTSPQNPSQNQPPLQSVIDQLRKEPVSFDAVTVDEESNHFVPRGEIADQEGEVLTLKFSGDGRRLISVTKGGSFSIWDVEADKQIRQFKVATDSPLTAVDVSFDGKLAVSAVGRQVLVWDLASGKQTAELEGNVKAFRNVALPHDSRLVCAVNEENKFFFWDLSTGDLLADRMPHHVGGESKLLRFAPDASWLMVDAMNASIGVDACPSGQDRFQTFLSRDFALQATACSNDCEYIAFANADGTVYLHQRQKTADSSASQLQPPQRTQRYKRSSFGTPYSKCRSLTIAPGDKYLLVYSGGEQIDYRRLPDGALAGRFVDNVEDVRQTALSPDGRHCASAYSEGRIRVWKLPSPRLTTSEQQSAFARQIIPLLLERKFDELEARRAEIVQAKHTLTMVSPNCNCSMVFFQTL